MAEYIELEPLREEIFNDDFNCDIINHFLNIVDFQPTADVVEVVRCKDCEKWDTSNKLLNTCVCTRWSQSMPYPRLTSPDDFCSYGHRKEGADNAT